MSHKRNCYAQHLILERWMIIMRRSQYKERSCISRYNDLASHSKPLSEYREVVKHIPHKLYIKKQGDWFDSLYRAGESESILAALNGSYSILIYHVLYYIINKRDRVKTCRFGFSSGVSVVVNLQRSASRNLFSSSSLSVKTGGSDSSSSYICIVAWLKVAFHQSWPLRERVIYFLAHVSKKMRSVLFKWIRNSSSQFHIDHLSSWISHNLIVLITFTLDSDGLLPEIAIWCDQNLLIRLFAQAQVWRLSALCFYQFSRTCHFPTPYLM